jgi:hypothetical protein
MALGIPEAIAEVAKLLSKVFGFVVDPTGLQQLTLENQLKYLSRGMNGAIEKEDWPTADALFNAYRELRKTVGP